MKNTPQYVPLHLSFFLVIGVLVGDYFLFNLSAVFITISSTLTFFILFYKLTKKHYQLRIVYQLLTYIIVFLIGIITISLQKPVNQKTHYSHFISNENKIVFQIEKKLKPTKYHYKYYAEVTHIDSTFCKGKILINIPKDSLVDIYQEGDVFFTNTSFFDINKPKNPHTFDYSNYLRNQGIYHQITAKRQWVQKLASQQKSTRVIAANLRDVIQKSLLKYNFKPNELGIINALVLGQRQSISKELLDSYAGAGAIHILAVSGLHVGILFLILGFVFKPIVHLPYGEQIKMLFIILLLWSFALLTGLSASVVRAVSMFTFIAIGLSVRKHRSSALHALISSFLVLVLINPLYIYDVGFQMSYVAVLGIVLLYPQLNALIPRQKWYLAKKITQLLMVSISATIATLPISLFYFHQFPGLFFLSNIVIVPFIGVIMGVGILVIVIALFDQSPPYLYNIVSESYGFVLSMMNWFIKWVAEHEQFLFKNISFSLEMVFVSYLFISLVYYFSIKRKSKRFIWVLAAISLFQIVIISEKYQKEVSNEIIIFNKSRQTIIGVRQADELQIYHSKDTTQHKFNFLKPYQVEKKITKIKYLNQIPDIFKYKDKTILAIDSLGVYKDVSANIDIVLLRLSPRINLKRLIRLKKPQLIIADASNYKSYVTRWKKTCVENKVSFLYTSVDGAYVME